MNEGINDFHISRLSGLKEKLKDLSSNLADSVICLEPLNFLVSSVTRWNTRRVCGHLCMVNPRHSLPALNLVARLGENTEPGALCIVGTQCMLAPACSFPWQWAAWVHLYLCCAWAEHMKYRVNDAQLVAKLNDCELPWTFGICILCFEYVEQACDL